MLFDTIRYILLHSFFPDFTFLSATLILFCCLQCSPCSIPQHWHVYKCCMLPGAPNRQQKRIVAGRIRELRLTRLNVKLRPQETWLLYSYWPLTVLFSHAIVSSLRQSLLTMWIFLLPHQHTNAPGVHESELYKTSLNIDSNNKIFFVRCPFLVSLIGFAIHGSVTKSDWRFFFSKLSEKDTY